MLIQHYQNPNKKKGINKESVVLLFGTEGATDPEIYKSIIKG